MATVDGVRPTRDGVELKLRELPASVTDDLRGFGNSVAVGGCYNRLSDRVYGRLFGIVRGDGTLVDVPHFAESNVAMSMRTSARMTEETE